MKVRNDSPLPAHVAPGWGPEDRAILSIVVKGTFRIVPGARAELAKEQIAIAFADELIETPRGALPRLDSDVAPYKPRADVLLLGRAYAPDGRPTPEFDVRLRVGRAVEKIVRVFGPREWEGGGFGDPKISKPKPFTTCDLAWTEAYGGVDAENGGASLENPVGLGMINDKLKKKVAVGRPLPRLEDPARLIESWKDHPSPAGFGTIGRGWEPRVAHLGTYDERWQKERAPRPPRDFSFEFHNSAPVDQQVDGFLAGDESFAIVNATEDGRLDGRLPAAELLVKLRRTAADRTEDVAMHLDTLVLDAEAGTMQLVWRGTPGIRALENLDVDEVKIDLHRG